MASKLIKTFEDHSYELGYSEVKLIEQNSFIKYLFMSTLLFK